MIFEFQKTKFEVQRQKLEYKDQTTGIIFKIRSLKLKYYFLNFKEHIWTISIKFEF